MGLLRVLGLTRFATTHAAARKGARRAQVEQLEQRQLLAADGLSPQVLLGGVYFEEATGDDSEPDILQVSFVGGPAGTTLNQIIINTDKDGLGLSVGDLVFDTAPGGGGTDGFASDPLEIISSEGFTVTGVSVNDGGTLVVIDLAGFEAGETLVFSVDVDEYQGDDPETGLPFYNSLVEGAEFQFSKLTGHFSAPGHVDLELSGTYYDFFNGRRDTAETATGLELDLPDDRYEVDDDKTDRTAGAVAHAPLLELATLSGYVYHDRSDDGVYDASETPIPQVELKLLKDGVDTGLRATTNQDGFYKFVDLEPGKYTVMEFQPDDWLDGKDTAGAHGGFADPEAGGRVDMISSVMLTYGDHAEDYNFGELLPGSIAGIVMASTGPDCNFDAPEILLEDVKIELLNEAGVVIATTTTDSQGRYKFSGLVPGVYGVREYTPDGYYDGEERAGDAGGDVADDLITSVAIGSDQHAVNYDFCEHIGATLSGYVYHDKSDDGAFDPSEDPIPEVELKLLKDGVDTGRRATTDAAGYYEFTNLAPGKYAVMEFQPSGWYDGKDTPGNTGGNALANDMIAEIMIQFGDNSLFNNFGELLGGSIAGRVHASTDGDCSFDDPEIPLAGVQIDLLDSTGGFIRSTYTDFDGRYKFDNLAPGEYQVREHQPTGYYDGDDHVGSAGGVLSNDLISQIEIGSDEHAVQYDFCEHVGATLSGYVYHDKSDDGVYDPSEDPIPQVELKLLKDGVDTGRRATTNSAGFYEFSDLEAGKYTVMEVQPSGWYDGKDTPGTTGGDASVNDMISQIMIQYGDNSQHNNFGELLGASIAGRVHASTGPDCDFENPEILLEGVQIDLLDAQGNFIRSTFTNADGRYKFDNLAPGEYQVHEHQPADYFDGDEHVGTAGGLASDDLLTQIVLGSDEHATRYDFCEHVGACRSGYVYHDRSDDGVYDKGSEAPISGVELMLLRSDGSDTGRRAITGADGFYKFSDLPPGGYTVMEVQPEGWLDGKDTAGSLGGIADSAADKIREIVINFGDDSVENNFGELLPGSIRGKVVVSTDPDCDPNDGEPPIEGVEIRLLDESGEVIAVTYTDENGEYAFVDLAPGVYSVFEVQPEDYFHGDQHVGTGGGAYFGQDLIGDVHIGSDQHWVQYDFCETPPASLSGYVFVDGPPILINGVLSPEDVALYRDGQRTSDDTPLAGVVLELRNGFSGDPIFGSEALPGMYPEGPIRTTTDANGYYLFDGLRAGNYAVVEVQPENLIDGIDTPGTLGGQAVNAEPPLDGQIIAFEDGLQPGQLSLQQFRLAFGNNVIARIPLQVGQHSAENNFSEVRTTPFFYPPQPPTPTPPAPLVVPPPIMTTRVLPAAFFNAPTPEPPFYGSAKALGWTWHLSVVNAGMPRSAAAEGATMLLAKNQFDATNWRHIEMDRAEWKLLLDDPASERLQHFVYGLEEGIPIAGDWNGD
ncbi:MAG: carboxypeptidase regulatory-like domain-containing protein, partial [Planctomycetales bacterium]|nr:carboxypeptidase regulatory-like domain-containing protein [Planctomycetales bacterium]